MRRKEREVKEISELLGIFDKCKICRIATQDDMGLYIIPMNFGYHYKDDALVLYIHSAKSGRKIDAFAKNPTVAFEVDYEHGMIVGETACDYGYAFESIVGTGEISVVMDDEEKKVGLTVLMKHQTGKDFTFDDKMANSVLVYKIEVSEFIGKRKVQEI